MKKSSFQNTYLIKYVKAHYRIVYLLNTPNCLLQMIPRYFLTFRQFKTILVENLVR